jgi:hypothetical protein
MIWALKIKFYVLKYATVILAFQNSDWKNTVQTKKKNEKQIKNIKSKKIKNV